MAPLPAFKQTTGAKMLAHRQLGIEPNIDRVTSFLQLLFGPEDVFEVRVLGAESDSYRNLNRVTKSGFFSGKSFSPVDGEHSFTAVRVVEEAKKAKGVYVTPQPLNPKALKYRGGPSQVRYRDGVPHPQPARDVDVLEHRYLIIDIDPIRAAGFEKQSATDDEKASAWAVAENVRQLFAEHHWAAPLVGDSGNGYHLYYRLPASSPAGVLSSVLADLLQGLSLKFDTERAKIDTTVYNPARIMKVLGTAALKGDNYADRPHRSSGFRGLVPSDWRPTRYAPPEGFPSPTNVSELRQHLPQPDRSDKRVSQRLPTHASREELVDSSIVPVEERIRRARAYCAAEKTPKSVQGQNGGGVLMSVVRAVFDGFALSYEQSFNVLWDVYNPKKCSPAWEDWEIRHKLDDVMKSAPHKPRGWKLAKAVARVGSPAIDPETLRGLISGLENTPAPDSSANWPVRASEVNEAEDDPHKIARLVLEGYKHEGERTLMFWRGQFHEWRSAGYRTTPEKEFVARLNGDVHEHLKQAHMLELAMFKEKSQGSSEEGAEKPKMIKVTRTLVSNVQAAIEGRCLVTDKTEAPAWVRDDGPNPREMVAAANGLVHLPAYAARQSDAIRPNTPCYFNFNALPYTVDRDAPEPREWMKFLASLWPDDAKSVMLLQEWFGYLLTPDTRQQKILLMKGPPRAGKGTICRLITALVGQHNCAAPNLHQFGEPFGLSTLIEKSVAVIGEAKLSHRSDLSQITERLQQISGEDRVDVNRKNLPLVTTRLNTRIVIAANLPPQLDDLPGALAQRWCPLVFTRSFKNKEDHNLFERLSAELSGIFNWAVAGWSRLNVQGRFTRPEASEELLDDMSESANPIKGFIASCCRLDEGEQVLEKDLMAAFRRWQQQNNADTKVKGHFRDLVEAACPEVKFKRIGPKTNRGPWYCLGLALVPNEPSDLCSYDTERSIFPADSIGEL